MMNTKKKSYPYVSEEYMKAVDKARLKLKGLIHEKRGARFILRFAWYCASTYDVNTKTGGPFHRAYYATGDDLITKNGSSFGPLGFYSGFGDAVMLLEPLKQQFPLISYGDFYQLAGVVAVEVTGGPVIPFHPGREDKQQPLAANGRLINETQGGDHLRDLFVKGMGLEEKDVVALCGGFALGVKNMLRTYKDDNYFFKNLLADEREGCEPPASYKVLLEDLVFRSLVEKYAADEDAFFADYEVSHMKFSELGFAEV